jgi:hypothetical protein
MVGIARSLLAHFTGTEPTSKPTQEAFCNTAVSAVNQPLFLQNPRNEKGARFEIYQLNDVKFAKNPLS